MFGSLDISTSALTAQRIRMDTIAGNIANAGTPAGPNGKASPYQRRVAVFAPSNPAAGKHAPGVHVARIVKDSSPPDWRHEPDHPLAVKEGKHKGYVAYPNVNIAVEMINALEAKQAYDANVTAMQATKGMIAASLRLLA